MVFNFLNIFLEITEKYCHVANDFVLTANEATGINTTIGEGFLSGVNTGIYYNGADAYSDFGSTVITFYIFFWLKYILKISRILEENFLFLSGLRWMG